MSRVFALLAAATALAAQAPTPAGPPTPKPPPPAVRPGMPVVDRSGARIGEVVTATETPRGLNIVVKVDGKLVGAPLSALTVDRDHVVSSQTKDQLLASSGAPP